VLQIDAQRLRTCTQLIAAGKMEATVAVRALLAASELKPVTAPSISKDARTIFFMTKLQRIVD
jgi:hypothetical protein